MRLVIWNFLLGLMALSWCLALSVDAYFLPASGLLAIATFATILFFLYLLKTRQHLRGAVLSLLLWFLGANLLLNEILRARQQYWRAHAPHEQLGWLPKPKLHDFPLPCAEGRTYSVTTNALGYRTGGELAEEGGEILPVAAQGDSNLFGYGLREEETLCARLNALAGQRMVINFGVSGYDCNQFYYQYELLTKRFPIRKRLILFNIDNDFTITALKTAYYVRRPYLYIDGATLHTVPDYRAPVAAQGYGNFFVEPYAAYDPLIRDPDYDWCVRYPAWLIREPLPARLLQKFHAGIYRLRGGAPAAERGEFARSIYTPLWLLAGRESWPEPYTTFARDFPVILRALRDQNPRLLIFLLPMREQLAKERDAPGTGALAFNQYIAEVCSELGIALLDPSPLLLETGNNDSLYQTGDEHLSARGMDLLARFLWDSGWLSNDD